MQAPPPQPAARPKSRRGRPETRFGRSFGALARRAPALIWPNKLAPVGGGALIKLPAGQQAGVHGPGSQATVTKCRSAARKQTFASYILAQPAGCILFIKQRPTLHRTTKPTGWPICRASAPLRLCASAPSLLCVLAPVRRGRCLIDTYWSAGAPLLWAQVGLLN